MELSLARLLRLQSPACVAFIGAGGKTTAMFRLAQELKPNVIVTATTHLGDWQTKFADKHILADTDTLDETKMDFQEVLLITGKSDGDRLQPVTRPLLNKLHQYCKSHSTSLLVEADGSRQKPLKGWADHEPPIPEFTEMVVHMAGLSGLGKTLDEEYVHRPQVFSRLSGLSEGETISSEAVARVFTNPKGSLKNIPDNAKRIAFLNQADTPELQSRARAMTMSLLTAYHSVITGSLLNEEIYAVLEPVAGVVLAAGGSTRFGKPKQLLDWRGQPFVRAVAQTALQAGLSPVIVVTGANADPVEASVRDLNVTTVRNEEWSRGQGSSIRVGVRALASTHVGGAVFLLSDQPQVTTAVIRALMEKHAEGLYPVVAPMVMDKRGNPVLFDRATFSDLESIEGDTGGRAIFHKHRVEYLPWHDDGLLLDVDTPEHYQRLISNPDL
jgi:molybdenum cofactor cytidylyltransferase